MKKIIIGFIMFIIFLAILVRNCSDDSIEMDEPITNLSSTNVNKEQYDEKEQVQGTILLKDSSNIEIPRSSHFLNEQILSRKAYTTSYNCITKCPNWVAWKLTDEHTDGPFSRKGVPYYCEDGTAYGIGEVNSETCGSGYFVDLETKESRQELSDWTGEFGMTHGHMCPAGDNKWDKVSMNQSFLLTNMCPQAAGLNGGSWKKLEEKCRVWAKKNGCIYVVAGPMLYDGKVNRTLGNGKIAVPDAFFKVVLCMTGNPKAIGFIYVNNDGPHQMGNAVCSVDNVEKLSGFDFFSSLPDDVEDNIESINDMTEWD